MSTITIRAEAYPRNGIPQRSSMLIIDGVRVNTGLHSFNFEMKQDLIDLPLSVDDPDAGKWKTYMPGIRTYTLALGDVPVMQTNDPPERRELDDGMIEWTWRNVAIEGKL
jgi:hypothetical protein